MLPELRLTSRTLTGGGGETRILRPEKALEPGPSQALWGVLGRIQETG